MSRVQEVCDEVRAMLADQLPEPASVSRAYSPSVDRKDFSGRTIWVVPAAYMDAQRLARKLVHKGVKVIVVVAERYESPAQSDPDEPVPNEWVDTRVDWVEEHVFDLLNETGVHDPAGRLLGRFQPWSCEVTVVFDAERLNTDKVFWSLIEVEYRETAEG